MADTENPVLNIGTPDAAPHAVVFVDKEQRSLTPLEAKRARYVKNLKSNYARLNEVLASFEYFASVCELSLKSQESIRKANKEAITELSQKLQAKLAEYDRRLKEGK